MAKKSAIERNKKRERLAQSYAGKRARLKVITMDKTLEPEERFAASLTLAELPRNSARVRVHNRCEISGRPKGYYRKLRMSRIALRDMASSGQIPGMVKSSW
ncbi:MAG: 30S ribosomal protein S14 [Alphaproteobacteria bacterium]